MRFEELSLRIPGDELRMRFHQRITVLSGLEGPERRGLVETLLGAMTTGPARDTVLTYRDGSGRRVTISRGEDGTVTHAYDDGSVAPDVAGVLGLDAADLAALIRVTESGVGFVAPDISLAESPELAEARNALAQLSEELDAALTARKAVEAMREELIDIDERLREAAEGESRRHYARLLADLERVRAEAAAVRTGDSGAKSDRRFLENARGTVRLAKRWQKAAEQLAASSERFGGRERLDADTLAEAESMPVRVPAKLDQLVRAAQEAETRRDGLAARLSSLATSRLPEPSHPTVVRLAGADQEAVWAVANEALRTGTRLEQESLALGGLDADGVDPAMAHEIEMCHAAVEEAERQLTARRRLGLVATGAAGVVGVAALPILPLAAPVALAGAAGSALWSFVGPRRQLAEAQGEEEDALVRAGVPTYLAFHIRRIDATIDPGARERLHLAALEHRVALKQWHELAGDLSPSDALSLEDEVRSYAAAVANLGGAADEIDALRRELTEDAEPAAERARTALMRACAPFGVDDPAMAVGMVRHQVEMAVTARLQQELEQAEADEAAQRDEVDVMLVQLGFTTGDLAARVVALEEAQGQARRRDQARGKARGREEVEGELARLEARVRQERRPEWGTSVVPNDAEEPDVADLVRRRELTAQAYETGDRLLPDVDLLADRHRAVERRVAVLEASFEPGLAADTRSDADEVQRQLLAQVVAARGAGPTGDPLPVLLDEPFSRLRGEKKWEVLDLVERLADKTQIVYLTDDHDVVMWARRRAASAALALLEPVVEGA